MYVNGNFTILQGYFITKNEKNKRKGEKLWQEKKSPLSFAKVQKK